MRETQQNADVEVEAKVEAKAKVRWMHFKRMHWGNKQHRDKRPHKGNKQHRDKRPHKGKGNGNGNKHAFNKYMSRILLQEWLHAQQNDDPRLVLW